MLLNRDLEALQKVIDRAKNTIDGDFDAIPFTPLYLNAKVSNAISRELIRNIVLAMFCVFVATFLLIGDVFVSVLVIISVLISVVNIGGFMYFWQLSIEPMTSVLLIIAFGLAIDYSAHVGHAFIQAEGGNRDEKTRAALTKIAGPAVLYGGVSTLLAFVTLAPAKASLFLTFFKIFSLIVCCGLFSGLVWLPIVLSLVGPLK